jgi:hypothetical protein
VNCGGGRTGDNGRAGNIGEAVDGGAGTSDGGAGRGGGVGGMRKWQQSAFSFRVVFRLGILVPPRIVTCLSFLGVQESTFSSSIVLDLSFCVKV